MNRSKRHFTEEAFLFSTFVEFNKCWRAGKKSRLVIESNVNGFAFVNFSAFLSYPKTLHVAPSEKRKPGSNVKPSKKKSKKKTERDNERAARFQAKLRESEAAAPAASDNPPPSATSSPRAEAPVAPSAAQFVFSEPTPENMSRDSNFSGMNVDGNTTIPSATKAVSANESNSIETSRSSKEEESSKDLKSSDTNPVLAKSESNSNEIPTASNEKFSRKDLNTSVTNPGPKPQLPLTLGWKVLIDEDKAFLERQSTHILEGVLQMCERDPKEASERYLERFEKYGTTSDATTVRTLDDTVTIAVHHLKEELRSDFILCNDIL